MVYTQRSNWPKCLNIKKQTKQNKTKLKKKNKNKEGNEKTYKI